MNVNCGDLIALKKLGEGKKNDFTTEQLLDENLKNIDGESNIEVRKRMLECINEIIFNNQGKRIVIVSHGAAIKFLLQHFCKFDFEENNFIFKNQVVCDAKLRAPSVLKIIFNDCEIDSMCKII